MLTQTEFTDRIGHNGLQIESVQEQFRGTSRPFVTLHYAQSLDGRIATKRGDSKWMSGLEGLRYQHQLRSEHGAVMVGIGTVLSDDPRLTVRLLDSFSPPRIVVDSALRIPVDANLLTDDGPPTIIATTDAAGPERVEALSRHGGIPIVVGATETGQVDLRMLGNILSARGIKSVLVEGGAGLITSLLAAQMADRMIISICPRIVGSGIEAVGDIGIDTLSQAITFSEQRCWTLGEDIFFEGTPVWQ